MTNLHSLIQSANWEGVLRYVKTEEGKADARGETRSITLTTGVPNNIPPGQQTQEDNDTLKESYPGFLPAHRLQLFDAPIETIISVMEAAPEALMTPCITCNHNLPLHHALLKCGRMQNCDDPVGLIRRMLELAPKSVKIPNLDGCVALHFAAAHCREQDDDDRQFSNQIIRMIFDAYPEGATINADRHNLPLKALPIHLAMKEPSCGNETILQFNENVSFLLKAYPESAEKADFNGHLPLHYACAEPSYFSAAVMKEILDCFPQALSKQDSFGSTPVSLLCARCETSLDASYLSTFWDISPESFKIEDKLDRLPLHYIAANELILRDTQLLQLWKKIVQEYPWMLFIGDKYGHTPLISSLRLTQWHRTITGTVEDLVRALGERHSLPASLLAASLDAFSMIDTQLSSVAKHPTTLQLVTVLATSFGRLTYDVIVGSCLRQGGDGNNKEKSIEQKATSTGRYVSHSPIEVKDDAGNNLLHLSCEALKHRLCPAKLHHTLTRRSELFGMEADRRPYKVFSPGGDLSSGWGVDVWNVRTLLLHAPQLASEINDNGQFPLHIMVRVIVSMSESDNFDLVLANMIEAHRDACAQVDPTVQLLPFMLAATATAPTQQQNRTNVRFSSSLLTMTYELMRQFISTRDIRCVSDLITAGRRREQGKNRKKSREDDDLEGDKNLSRCSKRRKCQ